MADDAGSLLVRAGLIAEDQLDSARKAQTESGGTVAEHLVLGGVISDEDLTRFYMERLLVPRVNSELLERISQRLLTLIPADMAAEFRVIPVALDREQNLTLAMSDPSHTHAADEIGFFTGTYVVRAVATQAQIAWALSHYYGQPTPLAPPSNDTPRTAIAKKIEAVLDKQPAQPSITKELDPTTTGPTASMATRPVPQQRQETPPELMPRAGEVLAKGSDRKIDELPAVVIDAGLLREPEERDEIVLLGKPRRKVATTLQAGGSAAAPARDPMMTTQKMPVAGDVHPDLETSSTELVLTFRRFEELTTRNEVIHAFLDYLQKTFERVAFLAVRDQVLGAFAVRAARPTPSATSVSMELVSDSMFKNVVDTRTPYRGTPPDKLSCSLIESMFGDATESALVLPLFVRDKVVGVFYADRMRRSSVPEHISAAARAAGLALERILKTRKFETIPPE